MVAALILGYAVIYCFLGASLGDFNPMRGQYNAIHNGMSVVYWFSENRNFAFGRLAKV